MSEGRIEQVRRQDLPERQRLVRPGGQVREHPVDRCLHRWQVAAEAGGDKNLKS